MLVLLVESVESLLFADCFGSVRKAAIIDPSKHCENAPQFPWFLNQWKIKSSLAPHRPAASASATPLPQVPSPTNKIHRWHGATPQPCGCQSWSCRGPEILDDVAHCLAFFGGTLHMFFLDKLTFSVTGQIRLCNLLTQEYGAFRPRNRHQSQDLCKKLFTPKWWYHQQQCLIVE